MQQSRVLSVLPLPLRDGGGWVGVTRFPLTGYEASVSSFLMVAPACRHHRTLTPEPVGFPPSPTMGERGHKHMVLLLASFRSSHQGERGHKHMVLLFASFRSSHQGERGHKPHAAPLGILSLLPPWWGRGGIDTWCSSWHPFVPPTVGRGGQAVAQLPHALQHQRTRVEHSYSPSNSSSMSCRWEEAGWG